MSHETPNAGFVGALIKCFPDEELVLYGEKLHLRSIQEILARNGIAMKLMRFRPIFASGSHGLPMSLYSCFHMLREIKRNNGDRVLFLSASPEQEYVVKKMCMWFFKSINCTFILHGAFEKLSGVPWFITPHLSGTVKKQPLIERLRGKSFAYIRAELWAMIWRRLKAAFLQFGSIECDIKNSLLAFQETDRFKHVMLSSHIELNAAKYIDTAKLNAYTITMPAIFSIKPPSLPINTYAKFAILGCGNTGLLQRLNMTLATLNIRQNYEIRLIGSDGRGIGGYPHVTRPIPRMLHRVEMEVLMRDIDMQMILYEHSRYRLCCSASILEAHAYAKPIIYLKNDCIDAFNQPPKSIGICCANVREMAMHIQRIVNNYTKFQDELQQYYKNILFHRNRINIMNNLHLLKDAMSFNRDV
jgi:hypothetical protein